MTWFRRILSLWHRMAKEKETIESLPGCGKKRGLKCDTRPLSRFGKKEREEKRGKGVITSRTFFSSEPPSRGQSLKFQETIGSVF